MTTARSRCTACPRPRLWLTLLALSIVTATVVAGCPLFPPPDGNGNANGNDNGVNGNDNSGGGNGNDNSSGGNGNDNSAGFSNTADKTNAAASYIGSNACRTCHADISSYQSIHGHNWKLNRVQGLPPEYPEEGTRAGVPDPPQGFAWTDIAYVIGGYTKKARYIDQDGYILTNGVNGVNTQWNLDFPPNGTTAGFVPYEPDAVTPKPYDVSCFECHTTGPMRQDEDSPQFQENRPGLIGTWTEAGVQCESCHGPGSGHFVIEDGDVKINRDRIFVDLTSTDTCFQCHNRPFDSVDAVIRARGGFIQHHEQYPELRASGGHASFTCVTCHDPHRSVTYDRANAIRNECTDCHAEQDMALHQDAAYVSASGYRETVGCQSCHMPYVTKSGSSALVESLDENDAPLGASGRIGDTRTHIFRIDSGARDYTSFFNDAGDAVRTNSSGQAAVTVDFVCLRCHNGQGNVFGLSVDRASEIASQMHTFP